MSSILKISVWPQSNGATFSITPLTKRKIKERFAESFSTSPVFITYDNKKGSEKPPFMFEHLIPLITGLNDMEMLAEMFEHIEIVDGDTESVLFSKKTSENVSLSRQVG